MVVHLEARVQAREHSGGIVEVDVGQRPLPQHIQHADECMADPAP
jgi:hypothetical protein